MYLENNIDFRIASATAIGQFKTAQAHSFLQVCRREFEFDNSARETVLLSYDRISGWLMAMEKEFLREPSHKLSKRLAQHALNTFKEELFMIEGICMENPATFSPLLIEFLHIVNEYSPALMKAGLQSIEDAHVARAYVGLADLATSYLQHLLVSMHELNNNLILHKDPFICVSPFCLMLRANKQECNLISLRTRATYFRRKLDQAEKTFTLKNYTDEDLSEESIRYLSEIGIVAKEEVAA